MSERKAGGGSVTVVQWNQRNGKRWQSVRPPPTPHLCSPPAAAAAAVVVAVPAAPASVSRCEGNHDGKMHLRYHSVSAAVVSVPLVPHRIEFIIQGLLLFASTATVAMGPHACLSPPHSLAFSFSPALERRS